MLEISNFGKIQVLATDNISNRPCFFSKKAKNPRFPKKLSKKPARNLNFCPMSTEKKRIFPFAIARVCGLPLSACSTLDELAIDEAERFEKTIANRHFLEAEWTLVFEKMQQFSHLPALEKSLLFASHDLLDRLPKFRETAVRDFVKKQRQTALGLYDFLARAATKTSPFAQFCSTQLISTKRADKDLQPVEPNFFFLEKMDDNPRWAGQQVFERDKTKLRHTLNVAIFERIFDQLLLDKNFADQLQIRLNPALRRISENHFSCLFFDNETEAFQHLENAAAEQIWLFFQKNNHEKTDRETLGNHLFDQFETTPEIAQSIVNQLISVGFLEFIAPISAHEPDWPARFLNRIAFFDFFEKQDELAALFHWLNGTAKQLGWMPTEAAKAAQIEAAERVSTFLGEKNAFSPEKIWFQDAATEHEIGIEPKEIEQLISSLRAAVFENRVFQVGNLQTRAAAFFNDFFEKKAVGFLEFAEAFLTQNQVGTSELRPAQLFSKGKLGAVLQVFKNENGKLCAVVNAIFPGGGRVFSRFLPLFSEKMTDSLKNWNEPDPFITYHSSLIIQKVGFYGQAFHNANLSPILTEYELDFHGSRPRLAPEKRFSLGEISVRFDENSGQLRAFLPEKKAWLELIDLGLESPDSRTPVLQLLRAISQQPISLAGMVDFLDKKEGSVDGFLPRLTFGDDLIFRRKTWRFSVEKLPHRTHDFAPENEWLLKFRAFQKRENLPRRCFYSFGENPQFVDFQSVISLRAFQKKLEKASGEVIFTEMLPLSGQLLDGGRAVELVVEFEI